MKQGIIESISVGQIVEQTCGDKRTEVDFALHIRRTIETDSDAQKWHLINDRLVNLSVDAKNKKFI